MSTNASEIISRNKFKILSGITAVAGTSAAAGTYFMPSSEAEHIIAPQLTHMHNSIVHEISNEVIKQTQTIEEQVQKVEDQIEKEQESLPEAKQVDSPVEHVTTPSVNKPTTPSPEVPATEAITTIQSTGKSTETDGVVQYQEGEFGKGQWSNQEAIPHDAPLSEWKDHEDLLIKMNTLNDGSVVDRSFIIPGFKVAFNKIQDPKNRSGNIWKTECTKYYRLSMSDMDSEDKNKRDTVNEVANWCGRARKNLAE